jgi:hypothetical protein
MQTLVAGMTFTTQGLGALLFAAFVTLTSLFKIAVLLIDYRFGELGASFELYAGGPAMFLLLLGPIPAVVAITSAGWAAYRARLYWIRAASLDVLVAALVFEVVAQVWFTSLL